MICNMESDGCNVIFDSLLLAQKHHAERIPSYLLNGNKYPMVLTLLYTKNHDEVWNLFLPQESIKLGVELTSNGIQFIIENLVRTKFEACM